MRYISSAFEGREEVKDTLDAFEVSLTQKREGEDQ